MALKFEEVLAQMRAGTWQQPDYPAIIEERKQLQRMRERTEAERAGLRDRIEERKRQMAAQNARLIGTRPARALPSVQPAQRPQQQWPEIKAKEYTRPATREEGAKALQQLQAAHAKAAFDGFLRRGTALPSALGPASAQAERKYLAARRKALSLVTTDPATHMATFTAYASTWAPDRDGDQCMPGCYLATIADAKAKALARGSKYLLPILWQHDDSLPLGGVTSMAEDSHGLLITGELDLNTDSGRMAYQTISAGYVDSLSIGYFVAGKQYQGNMRLLTKLNLFEISIVTIPANEQALIQSVN